MKILTVIGTRPEAIKMAPLIKTLEQHENITSLVCVTAQHREMLDQVLDLFDIKPDFDLNLMAKNQSLNQLASKILYQLEPVLVEIQPDAVLVHGDTCTTFAASMAAFYLNIPVMHIEAGLRTYNLFSPWPEEAHRQLTSKIAALHFAPSKHAAQHLYDEHIDPAKVIISGNTVIDALLLAKKKIDTDQNLLKAIKKQFDFLNLDKRIVLITVHRRENFGEGIYQVITAIKILAKQYPDVQFVLPVHPNPNVQQPIYESLSTINNIFLIAPQDYLPFVWLMSQSSIILTDSGGIQEEAPSFNVPVLVMRDTTERQEALAVGTIKLVGTHPETIVSEMSVLLDNPSMYNKIAQIDNPYGDGHASEIIVQYIQDYFK